MQPQAVPVAYGRHIEQDVAEFERQIGLDLAPVADVLLEQLEYLASLAAEANRHDEELPHVVVSLGTPVLLDECGESVQRVACAQRSIV